MFPGMNKRGIEAAMKKMGIKQHNIDASEVIIKTPEKDIIISEPQVARVEMMGQETFQISGNVSERAPLSEEDVKTVSEQAGVSLEDAEKTMNQGKGDFTEGKMKIKRP